jgi:hypothetical protein
VPDAASGAHPFDTAGGQQARRSVRVFITHASLCDISNGGDAGMWVEPEPGERSTLIIDEVKEHEGFQEPSKVGWRHQACDRSVFLSACPFGDSRTGTALNKSCWRHKFAFLNVSLKTGALPSALFVHHSKSSIIVCAGLLNSLLIRVAGTPSSILQM